MRGSLQGEPKALQSHPAQWRSVDIPVAVYLPQDAAPMPKTHAPVFRVLLSVVCSIYANGVKVTGKFVNLTQKSREANLPPECTGRCV